MSKRKLNLGKDSKQEGSQQKKIVIVLEHKDGERVAAIITAGVGDITKDIMEDETLETHHRIEALNNLKRLSTSIVNQIRKE